jgi:hypothetical protein
MSDLGSSMFYGNEAWRPRDCLTDSQHKPMPDRSPVAVPRTVQSSAIMITAEIASHLVCGRFLDVVYDQQVDRMLS